MPESPIDDNSLDEITRDLEDLITQQVFGHSDFDKATDWQQGNVRNYLLRFQSLAGNLKTVSENIKNDTLSRDQYIALKFLVDNEDFKEAFINKYSNAFYENTSASESEAETEGYQLLSVLRQFSDYIKTKETLDNNISVEDKISAQVAAFGSFKVWLDHIDTSRKLRDRLDISAGGKWRQDNPPSEIADWQCRIGASNFYVPPTSISVVQTHKTSSLAGAALRQPNSPKVNLGHSQTTVMMTIYFPTHESIWGFEGDQPDWQFHNWDPQSNLDQEISYYGRQTTGSIVDDRVIDNYLSSLRGLITQFKYMPFLPVRNSYLNRVHDIDAVTMNNMTVSTVENFPFVAAVTLEMSKFNYDPYMPMLDHFDQAIHWGKFRQMAGRSAANLQSRVNKSFLIERTGLDFEMTPEGPTYNPILETRYGGEFTPTLDKGRDISDGRYFDIYFPTSTPSRIFAPDTTDFRQPGEDEFFTRDYWDFIIGDLGFVATETPDFNFFEYDTKRKFFSNEREILRRWLDLNKVIWEQMTSDKFQDFVNEEIANGQKNGSINVSNVDAYRALLESEWFYVLFEDILTKDPIFQKIKSAKESQETDYVINEWEVPMSKVDIDWTKCVVTGVGVSLSNKYASLQLQMQDEPTYQHIGGGDSMLDVEMVVLGEDNIMAFRRVFQHINGLARLEKAHGVLGFLGIKNVFTALCGIKYVLPISFEVHTRPGIPNVYDVRMSFIDFDVMQQQREKIDSSQQQSLIDQFGKANPFLRIKQTWGATNCYPDFPLAMRDDDGAIIGHLDPDWYFRSFKKDNTDLVEWGLDARVTALIQEYSTLDSLNPEHHGPVVMETQERKEEIREELKILSRQKVKLPDGWEMDKDGNFTSFELDNDDFYNPDKREYRYFLGAYGEDQSKIAIIDMFNGGTFLLGEQDTDTEKVTYYTGYSMLSEDLASKNLQNVPSLESTTPLPQYQQEYVDGSSNPNLQYESMMKDWSYRALDGRMLKAFPTYMLWLIDEGGRFAGIKLFDNLYSLNSIIDFSVSQSASDPISDTLVLRLSNIYQKLTRPYDEGIFSEDDPQGESGVGVAAKTIENRKNNLKSGLFDSIVQLENIRLKPGVRVHLRAGWGNNPNALQTIFNGVITEVEAGEVMTVIAQSDAVELSSFVNTQSKKDHSGKLDGALNNFWLSEPRDLMVRLLSMGSSNFREWLAWGSKGVFFSESRFGIRHFGSILYGPMTQSESTGAYNMQVTAHANVKDPIGRPSGSGFSGLLGENLEAISEINDIVDFFPGQTATDTLGALTLALWTNSFARRDYEVFKRNIYPGNGTGIAQFMGGDLLDAGILVTQAGTLYDEDTAGNADPRVGSGGGVDELDNPTSNANQLPNATMETNEQSIRDFWNRYFEEEGISEDEFVALLETAEQPSINIGIDTDAKNGFLDQIFNSKNLFNAGRTGLGWIVNPLESLDDRTDIFNGFGMADLILGPFALVKNNLKVGSKIANGLIRFGASPTGQALGLSQIISDSDIAGFDETAFRAQTYMKTVWDLFEVCAALLPNYIVAVRPFEDRSTVFYGKPHWLYTSGLIPITTGVQTQMATLEPDEIITKILGAANGTNHELDRMITTARQASGLKDIESFLLGENFDPFNATGVAGETVLISDEAIENAFDELEEENLNLDVLEAFKTIDYSDFTEEELTDLANSLEGLSFSEEEELPVGDRKPLNTQLEGLLASLDINDQNDFIRVYFEFDDVLKEEDGAPQKLFEQVLKEYVELRKANTSTDPNSDLIHNYDELWKEIGEDSKLSAVEKTSLQTLLAADPITFAYQFGWRYSRTPVWIGTEANYGYDVVGDLARQRYDEDHSASVSVIGGNSGRTESEAYDIWYDFRRVYRYRPEVQEIYKAAFPFEENGENYDAVIDTFIRFLWQDPFNRAWLVLVPNRSTDDSTHDDGYYDKTQEFDGTSKYIEVDGSRRWTYEPVDGAWQTFLVSNDIAFDGNGVPISGSTKAWMRANAKEGSSSTTPINAAFDTVGDWFDENVGQVIGLVIDSITGLVASLRLSLAQLSQGLQMSGEMQRQANVLNATLNDSVYYQLGGEDNPIARLVDNCFGGETEYWTRDGLKTLGQTIGTTQTVLTSQGWKPAEIKSFGEQPLYRVNLSRGGVKKIIYATKEHRWFVDSSPLTADAAKKIERDTVSLLPGQRLTRCKPRSGSTKARFSPVGIQQGFVFGDGTRDRGYTIAYLYGEKDKALDKYFALHHRTKIKSAMGIDGIKIVGLPKDWKDIPSREESPNHLIGWLMGYFAADGCVSRTGVVTLHSNTKENLEFVEDIMNTKLGMASYGIRESLCEENDWRPAATSYTLTFCRRYIPEDFFIIDEHASRFYESKHADLKRWVVDSIEETDRFEEVFCAVVPSTHDFCLDGNILTGNCFTREYNEPVIEIREPFQRVHMVNSRKDILNNQIRENLNDVATVVTAVSDGKNPVTVHFDKGVAPERQIETVVETGIYWDNALGSGFFGFLQPLINPLESIRGFKKGLEGTSDQLSARRIALYHLKNGLKNIYEGEIILLGNTEIRPHDLLYIADTYERIYGMVEVESVIHHFTPETGFITSITPNALVSVNDPGRWTMLSYLGNKFTSNLMRDEMRALMSVGVDRFVAQGLDYLDSEDLYTQFSDHIEGAAQWTHGNTGLVRDLGAVFAGGGIQGLTERDRQAANILKLDIGLSALKPVATVTGAAAGLLAGPAGAVVGAGVGYGVSDLLWTAWQWVKDNLLDQNGCYVQFLNKEGQAMDAGLSYFQNSVVGANHTLSLFPSIFGIPISSPNVQVRQGDDGHFRITTNDLLANLGWTEVETLALYRDVSMFVNDTNANILQLAGRDPDGGAINNDDFDVFLARILIQGEEVGSTGEKKNGVVDGDTLDVEVIDSANSPYSDGVIKRVRVAAVNTYEVPYKDNAYTAFNESAQNDPKDLGYLAQQYLTNKFQSGGSNNIVAIRVRKRQPEDDYGRLVGTIFHNTPPATPPSFRAELLLQYARSNPPIPMHAYMTDGRPYTLNWEIVMAGYGNVDMRESLWETDWRSEALGD